MSSRTAAAGLAAVVLLVVALFYAIAERDGSSRQTEQQSGPQSGIPTDASPANRSTNIVTKLPSDARQRQHLAPTAKLQPREYTKLPLYDLHEGYSKGEAHWRPTLMVLLSEEYLRAHFECLAELTTDETCEVGTNLAFERSEEGTARIAHVELAEHALDSSRDCLRYANCLAEIYIGDEVPWDTAAPETARYGLSGFAMNFLLSVRDDPTLLESIENDIEERRLNLEASNARHENPAYWSYLVRQQEAQEITLKWLQEAFEKGGG